GRLPTCTKLQRSRSSDSTISLCREVQHANLKTLVRKGGFEPPRLSAPPPQDGVSASSTTSAGCTLNVINNLATSVYEAFSTAPDFAPASGTLLHAGDLNVIVSGHVLQRKRLLFSEPCIAGPPISWAASTECIEQTTSTGRTQWVCERSTGVLHIPQCRGPSISICPAEAASRRD